MLVDFERGTRNFLTPENPEKNPKNVKKKKPRPIEDQIQTSNAKSRTRDSELISLFKVKVWHIHYGTMV